MFTLPDFSECFHVEIEKRYAVEPVHITVNVPRCCRRQEQILAKQLRHLAKRERVETVEAILCGFLLPEPHKHMPFLLAECSPDTDNFSKLSKVVPDFLFANISVLVEERETEVSKNVFLHVAIELDQSVAFAVLQGDRWGWTL